MIRSLIPALSLFMVFADYITVRASDQRIPHAAHSVPPNISASTATSRMENARQKQLQDFLREGDKHMKFLHRVEGYLKKQADKQKTEQQQYEQQYNALKQNARQSTKKSVMVSIDNIQIHLEYYDDQARREALNNCTAKYLNKKNDLLMRKMQQFSLKEQTLESLCTLMQTALILMHDMNQPQHRALVHADSMPHQYMQPQSPYDGLLSHTYGIGTTAEEKQEEAEHPLST